MRLYYEIGGHGGVKTYLKDDFTINDLIFLADGGSTRFFLEQDGAVLLSGLRHMVNFYARFIQHCDTGISIEHVGEFVAFVNSKYSFSLGFYGGEFLFSHSDAKTFFKMLFDYVGSLGVTLS